MKQSKCRLYCLVQPQILVFRMTLSIWPINCILFMVTVLAFVWRMMSLSHTWYVLAELKSLISFVSFSRMHAHLLHLQYDLGVTDSLVIMIDICWCWLHSSPFTFWAMRTDPTYSNEIWFNTSCSKNWRCVHTYSTLLSKNRDDVTQQCVYFVFTVEALWDVNDLLLFFTFTYKCHIRVVIAHILSKLPLH